MEEESLINGFQRIKFTCYRKGKLSELFNNGKDKDDYLKLAKELASEYDHGGLFYIKEVCLLFMNSVMLKLVMVIISFSWSR